MDSSTSTPPTPTQIFLAEAVGSLILVVVTCAGIGAGVNATSAGFALVALTYAFGRISGGHFNPAVTVGSALASRTAWSDAVKYIGAQLVGALVAGIVLLVLALGYDGFEVFDENNGTLSINVWGDDGSGYAFWAAVVLTLVATAFFVLIFLAMTDTRSEHAAFAPLAIGLALVATLSLSSEVGGTVNPAQSLVTALFSGVDPILQVWVFLVGPLLGAVAAGFGYNALFGADRDPVPGSGLNFSSKPAYDQGYNPGGYQPQWGQQAPGGYQPPQQGQPNAAAYAPAPVAATPEPQAPVEQPIIQDGWQWDPQAQQWIPAQQPPAGGNWAPGSGEQTQVRPTDGS